VLRHHQKDFEQRFGCCSNVSSSTMSIAVHFIEMRMNRTGRGIAREQYRLDILQENLIQLCDRFAAQ
jgi:hypothetical protein